MVNPLKHTYEGRQIHPDIPLNVLTVTTMDGPRMRVLNLSYKPWRRWFGTWYNVSPIDTHKKLAFSNEDIKFMEKEGRNGTQILLSEAAKSGYSYR